MKKDRSKTSTDCRRAYLYSRVSSKDQEVEGYSLDSQQKLLRQYAEDNGLHVDKDDEYLDVETAKEPGREQFAIMVDELQRRKRVKGTDTSRPILLVEKTDRLYRNIKDWVTVDDLGLEIHFVKENVILSPESHSSEKFMHGIKVLMAKNYVENLSEETRKGMLEKAEQGVWPSFAPLGYLNIKTPAEKKIIVPDPEISPLIQKVFEWYASGRYSLRDVTRLAATAGLCTRKSHRTISKSAMHKIMTNRLYYGDFEWNGKLYRGTHEPLISKAVFDAAQDVLRGNGHHRPRPKKRDWAFQGLIYCGHCGCAMVAERKKGRYVYYHCTHNKGKCPERYVREEEVDRQFKESLKLIQLDSDVLKLVVKALKESSQDEKAFREDKVSALQLRNSVIQSRIEAMYTDKLDGKITQGMYERKSEAWRREQVDILREIEAFQNTNRTYYEEGVQILELAQRAVKLYEKQTIEEKRRLLNFVYSNSTWSNGQLNAIFRKPFDLLAVTSGQMKKEKAAFGFKGDPCSVWLPEQDSNLRHGG